MERNPKVSIVIPVYNGSDYIKESLESALNQTYENIEIIVVNDGSCDKGATKKIVEKYVEKYPDKIRYFEKENGGVSTALNLALEKMNGEYFSWLSHDDRYYPQKIEKQVEYIKKFDSNTVLYSDYDLMDSHSSVFATANKNHKELMEKKEYSLLTGAVNGITLFIPKKAFDECGNFRVDLKCTQDYELWLRMIKKGYEFIHQPEVLSTTRLHRGQTTNTSPRVVSEGNTLWINLIEAFPAEKKIELDNSEYEYYSKIRKFLKDTPYDGALKYVEEKMKSLEDDASEKAKNTLVSVIIPFYNRFDLVKNAVESVLKQTHKNIEIILVNDGSDEDFLNKYEGKEKVKLINLEKNAGVSNARNIGIENAGGDYIAMLDSDDLFLEDKIKKQLEYMIVTDADFSYTSYIRNTGTSEIPINCDMTENMVERCIYNCNIATPTIMLKKSFLEEHHLKYDTSLHIGEDCCLYMDILRHTPIRYIDEYLTVVNTNDNSASQNVEKLACGLKNILAHALSIEEYYKETHAIAHLCCGIVTTVLSDEVAIVPAASLYTIAPKETLLKRAWRAYREKGLVYCLKRPFRGLKARAKRYYKALKQNGIGYCFERVCHKLGYICIVIGRKLKIKK